MTNGEQQAVDGTSLLDGPGVDADEIESRKQIVRFDEVDAGRLVDMEPLFDEMGEDTLDEFDDHFRSHSGNSAVLDQSSRSIEELKRLQAGYLQGLGSGSYDRSYFEQRTRVEELHEIVDLDPKIRLGLYSLCYKRILDGITSSVVEEVGSQRGDRTEDGGTTFESGLETVASEIKDRTLSVLKLLLLDQQIAIDTYVQSDSEVPEEIERQRDVATDVQQSISQLEAGANVVEHSAHEINEITNEQVEAVQQVSSEMSDLSATVEEIAASAEEVNVTSAEAEETSEGAVNTAQGAIEKIEGLEEAAASVSTNIRQLRDSVAEIDELVKVIDNIANQTNLLAINASIEAANAGSSGDGFAVVADEVKSLAEDSQQQAETIKNTIEQIQKDTAETVDGIEEANDYVTQATDEVHQTVEGLDQIREAVREVSTGIEEVADATDDQAASTEEVASMMENIQSNTEQISDKIDDVVIVVNEQTERTGEIDESLDQLTDER